MPAGQVRRRLGVAGALLVLAATSGCGFMNDLAHPEAPDATVAAEGTPADGGVLPAGAVPAPETPTVIAAGALTTAAGTEAGYVTVTVGPVVNGLAPPVPNLTACPMDAPSLQYVPVDFAFTASGFAAHVAISRGPATPADVADVGIFAESADGNETYCDDAPPLPSRDRFFNQMGAATITVYVALDQAVTPATPDGRSEVFPTLQLRISDLRQFEGPSRVHGLGVGVLTVGATCADDPDAICVPLG